MAYFTGQINTNVDSGIAIAGGKIDNLSGIHKFGLNLVCTNCIFQDSDCI